MNIQKYLLVILSIATTLQISAWGYRVNCDNRTDGEMAMKVMYDAPGVCTQENKLIGARAKDGVDAGLCCINTIELKATSGRSKGKTWSGHPPNGTCNSMDVIAENTADGGFVARIENR